VDSPLPMDSLLAVDSLPPLYVSVSVSLLLTLKRPPNEILFHDWEL
jgi:hypothetical protein